MRQDQFQGPRRGQLGPSRQEQGEILRLLNALQRSGGAGITTGPGGIFGMPPDPDEIWVVVKSEEGSGNGVNQGSGQGNIGALHAFRQIRFLAGLNGTWEEDPSGIFGFPQYNPLVELNGLAITPGEVVRAYRGPANLCWVTVWGGGGSGSGGLRGWDIVCTANGARATPA